MKWMYNASGDLVPYGQGDPSHTLKVIYDPMKYRQHNGPLTDHRQHTGPLTDHRQHNGPLTRERFEDPPTPAPAVPESLEFQEAISKVGDVIKDEIHKAFEIPLAIANAAKDAAVNAYNAVTNAAKNAANALMSWF